MKTADERTLTQRCRDIRLAVLRQAELAGVGHYGSVFSAVEILASLYDGFMDVDAANPDWPERDRLVLSKGHACTALYPILVDLGFFAEEHLQTFSRLGSILGDNPDMRKVPGIDFSAGSLGHGLSIGVGMAEGLLYQDINSRVVIVIGDGEQNEGQVWEAAAYAGHNQLSNLLVICDRNDVQVDGPTDDVMGISPMAERWESFGWRVIEVDGHDLDALAAAYRLYDAERADGEIPPTIIIAQTISGYGVPFIEGDADWHLGYLHGEDYDEAVSLISQMPKGGQT